jgi:hypothetical protein
MLVGTLPVRDTVPMPLLAWDRRVEAGGEQWLVLYGEACLRWNGGKYGGSSGWSPRLQPVSNSQHRPEEASYISYVDKLAHGSHSDGSMQDGYCDCGDADESRSPREICALA